MTDINLVWVVVRGEVAAGLLRAKKLSTTALDAQLDLFPWGSVFIAAGVLQYDALTGSANVPEPT